METFKWITFFLFIISAIIFLGFFLKFVYLRFTNMPIDNTIIWAIIGYIGMIFSIIFAKIIDD
jgi:hypothetical protein